MDAPHRRIDSVEPAAVEAAPVRSSLVDSAVYVEGVRVDSPRTVAESYRLLRA